MVRGGARNMLPHSKRRHACRLCVSPRVCIRSVVLIAARQCRRRLSSGPMKSAFRSLNGFNYRVWAGGAFVSNVGTWMHRTALDWCVLTQLTHNNPTAVGAIMALQFGPQLILLPLTGLAADYLDRRKLLIATQAAMGALALGLAILTICGLVQLWHAFLFALLLGGVPAFDSPARHTFVLELVGQADLSNAVALNSASFNTARMVGPAVAGVLVALTGSGWVFLISAVSFAALLCSLGLLRVGELHLQDRALRATGNLADGFRYVWKRPDLKAVLVMLFLIGTFGLNFPIFIATMSIGVFHADWIGCWCAASCEAGQTRRRASARCRRNLRIRLRAGCHMPNYWLFGL